MEVEGILALCVEEFVCLHSFLACPLSHTHLWCMFGMSWQLEAGLTGEQQQLFQRQTRFLDLML